MFVILDLDINNAGSLHNMVKRVGHDVKVSCKPQDLQEAKGIFLPGNGSFDAGMNAISKNGLLEGIEECVFERKIPILGICLGMQLLSKGSEEGSASGLGWLDARVEKIKSHDRIKIPHMGWNEVKVSKRNNLILDHSYHKFYFVHSYHLVCNDPKDVIMQTHHGQTLTAGVQKDNIFGVQFHPEKSHSYGAKLLKSFCEYSNAV